MLKKIRLLILISLVFLISIEFVGAYTISSDNNPGSAHTSGTGSNATAGTNWGNPSQLKAVRIRVFRDSTVVKSGYYSLATSDSGCYSSVTGTVCETSSYNYSSVTDTTGVSCSASATLSLGCIVGANLNYSMYWDSGAKANGTYLDNILKADSYANLKSLLEGMGYNDTNFNDSDVVIVEPVTSVICNGTKYLGTSTALMKKNVSYRGSSGNACSGNDGYNGYTFSNVFKNMSKAFKVSTSDFGNESYTGFGFFEYNVSDVGFVLEQHYLDLNGYLDSVLTYNIIGYGTADVYINGTLVADDVSDYYTQWPVGTTYEITDIKAAPGKQYDGLHSGYSPISGTITEHTSVYLDFSTIKGGLKVIKTNSNNDALAQLSSSSTAKFKLYNSSNCSGNAIKDFKAGDTVSGLLPGTYYLKEYETKNGYHLPEVGETWYCDAVTITAGETNELTVENKTECEYKFRSNMTMKERIDLYNLIKTNYQQNFNALLNMNNVTAANACASIELVKKYDKSCFGASSYSTNDSSFSESNVSMHTERYGNYTFCLTTYNLVNELGKSNFRNIKSGRAIINTDDVVATATLNRVCYNFGDTSIVDQEYNNFSYSNYVESDASINNVPLSRSETSSGILNNKTITVNYTLPYMYSSNKDGRVSYNGCPSGQYCKQLGRGIVSKFNLEPGTYDLGFNIELSDKLGDLNIGNDCKYTVENELINNKNKLNIQFRIVNTDSDALFVSKDGQSNRKIGKNWHIISEEQREYILNQKNNSYNKNNETALYTITLTPETIREIRENNKGKNYDDYNMTCVENGTICISNYLTCLSNEGILFIRERKNIDKFNLSQIACIY